MARHAAAALTESAVNVLAWSAGIRHACSWNLSGAESGGMPALTSQRTVQCGARAGAPAPPGWSVGRLAREEGPSGSITGDRQGAAGADDADDWLDRVPVGRVGPELERGRQRRVRVGQCQGHRQRSVGGLCRAPGTAREGGRAGALSAIWSRAAAAGPTGRTGGIKHELAGAERDEGLGVVVATRGRRRHAHAARRAIAQRQRRRGRRHSCRRRGPPASRANPVVADPAQARSAARAPHLLYSSSRPPPRPAAPRPAAPALCRPSARAQRAVEPPRRAGRSSRTIKKWRAFSDSPLTLL